MATRNRTAQFRRHRDAVKSVRAPLSSSAPSSSGPVIEMMNASLFRSKRSSYAPLSTEDPEPSSSEVLVGLPPAWVDDAEEISANIHYIRRKIAELVRAHSKALMPSFADGKEDQYTIEVLSIEITNCLKASEKRLKKMSISAPSEDFNVRKNVQRSLATELQNLSMDLRKRQSMYLKHLQQQKEGHDGIDLEINLNGKQPLVADDGYDDLGINENQMMKFVDQQFTEGREKEMGQVVKSVNELAQIMKDLSVLVIDQGTIVDRIDHNIQNVAVSVEEGLKQLQKAERTQKNGGMVRCATVLVVMCFIMLVLLILKEIIM